MKSILIVDDDVNVLNALNRLLRSSLYELELVKNPLVALELVQQKNFDLIISDQKMPEMSGVELLESISDVQPQSNRIILSAYSDFNEIVAAFNSGYIHQFMAKPWDDDTLKAIVSASLDAGLGDLGQEAIVASPKGELGGLHDFHGLLSGDPEVIKLFAKIRKAAASSSPVYIYGETGTGKELVARAVHQESCNAEGQFVAFNCANFSEQLVESQLFGHVKGAFTGATENKQGLLSVADGGVLFLDEIASLPLDMQAKLLRALQEKEYMPVGSVQQVSFDAIVVSASNQHLCQSVSDGEFREDLYYRLCVIPISLMPLRERGTDSLNLFRHYLQQISATKTFRDSDVGKIILSYDWPGNVRQLINVCQYVAAMSEGDAITIEDFPEEVLKSISQLKVESLELSAESIQQALDANNNNRSAAARSLDVSRMTLWRKMKEFSMA